jgi:hypothetical protein
MNTKSMNTKSRKRQRVRVLITTGTLIPLLGVGAATAAFMPGGIGQEWQQWVLGNYQNPLAQIQAQITNGKSILEQLMKGGLGDFWQQIQSVTGSQAPDPYAVRTTDKALTTGVLNSNPIVGKRDAANLYDQELGRAMAAPVLGTQGQTWIEQKAQRTSGLVENNQQGFQTIQKLANEAQSLTVTQDVMKNNAAISSALAGILTNQSRLTADNHTALLNLQQLQGMTAQLAANTSEGIDEANRRERTERQVQLSNATHAPLYIPGILGTGSQGRK